MNTVILIGQLFKTVGAVEGRKKLQKIVHILQCFGVPFHIRFGYLHYGPFSSELQSQLDIFEAEGLLKEEPCMAGNFKTSRFSPQPALLDLVQKVAGTEEANFAGMAEELNGKSAHELEAISTLLYLRSLGTPEDKLREVFVTLKPKFKDVFEQRLQTVSELRQRYAGNHGLPAV